MTVFRADWLLPISDAPHADGWLAVEGGRIAALGSAGADMPSGAVDLGRVVVLPGLVNAHTHLELSHLLDVIPPASRFGDWVQRIIHLRGEYPDPTDPRITSAARAAIQQARAAGTALLGDISNTLVTHAMLVEAGMPGVVFYELLGFNTPDAHRAVADARGRLASLPRSTGVRTTLAAHAPYSVSPELFKAIRADLDQTGDRTSSVHLSESPEEVEFVRSGTGAPRAQLEAMGRWNDAWQAPGCTPVEYLEGLGFLGQGVLVVHGVQLTGSDLDRIRALDATIVSCPRSNAYVGVGAPPLEAFYAMDVRVAFGTDSLASVKDLNMFAEIAAARRIAPRVPARALLESATLEGARALGFDAEFGSLDAGKRAALIAVCVPEGVTDVEEYVVSGIDPDDVRWLD